MSDDTKASMFGIGVAALLLAGILGGYANYLHKLKSEKAETKPVVQKVYVERCQDCGAIFTSDRPVISEIRNCPLCPLEPDHE